VASALETPLFQIVKNSGQDGHIVVDEVKQKKGNHGYNAFTEQYCDLVKDGIIDPALVARTALQNAASVAGLMLTTSVLVTEVNESDEPVDNAVT